MRAGEAALILFVVGNACQPASRAHTSVLPRSAPADAGLAHDVNVAPALSGPPAPVEYGPRTPDVASLPRQRPVQLVEARPSSNVILLRDSKATREFALTRVAGHRFELQGHLQTRSGDDFLIGRDVDSQRALIVRCILGADAEIEPTFDVEYLGTAFVAPRDFSSYSLPFDGAVILSGTGDVCLWTRSTGSVALLATASGYPNLRVARHLILRPCSAEESRSGRSGGRGYHALASSVSDADLAGLPLKATVVTIIDCDGDGIPEQVF